MAKCPLCRGKMVRLESDKQSGSFARQLLGCRKCQAFFIRPFRNKVFALGGSPGLDLAVVLFGLGAFSIYSLGNLTALLLIASVGLFFWLGWKLHTPRLMDELERGAKQ